MRTANMTARPSEGDPPTEKPTNYCWESIGRRVLGGRSIPTGGSAVTGVNDDKAGGEARLCPMKQERTKIPAASVPTAAAELNSTAAGDRPTLRRCRLHVVLVNFAVPWFRLRLSLRGVFVVGQEDAPRASGA